MHRHAAMLCAAALAGAAVPALAADRPNVVLFLVDDMGWRDSSTYGSRYYETPNMDRLASAGMRFTSAYAASPVCSPTRACILTGNNPARLHVTDWISGHGDAGKPLAEPEWTKQLRQDQATIAEALKSAGYATAHVGKWHLGQSASRSEANPTTQGFDINIGGNHLGQPNGPTGNYFADSTGSFGLPGLGSGSSAPGEYLTDRLTTAATSYIRQQAAADQPFFLNLAHYAVHTPLQAKPDLVAKYQAKPGADGQSNATYAAMLDSMDQSLGLVLDTLNDPNGDGDTGDSIAGNTLVLFMSDNGGLSSVTSNAPLRAGKGTNYEGGIRVPFMVNWPGHTAPGSVSDQPVAAWDVFNTVMDVAGLPRAASAADSVSLVPVLEGTGTRPGPLYFHYPHYHTAGATPFSAIRDGDWKLILNYETGGVQLYNLATDIGETANLASAQPARAAELRLKLEEFLIETEAQLPAGTPVQLDRSNPRGARVISINLGTGPSTTLDPQEFAGVIEENHWNNAISAGSQAGQGSIASLVNGNGHATGASFAFEAGYMYYNNNGGSADYRMMEGWGGNKASDANEYTVSGLPDAFVRDGYDLYIYYDSNDIAALARQMSFRIGGTTLYGKELPANFNGFFVEAGQEGVSGLASAREGNYVVFRGLHLRDFSLVVDATNGRRAAVNGIQIVQVPEPVLILPAALAALAFARRRPRRLA